jgi:hypothetical protein
MKIVWLASYPKSGNTFARMLLYTYQFGKSHNSDAIGEKIPDIHLLMHQGKDLDVHSDQRTFVKTHFCHSANHPHAQATDGYIYILRNPRDVLLSNARYFGETENLDNLRKFSLAFINKLGVPRWRQEGMGSWNEHLASWLYSANKVPHIFIKYEDLRINTVDTLKHIVRFLGEEPDNSRIQMAVKECAIDEARKFEIEEKRRGRKSMFCLPSNNTSFVGEGKMGQSLAFIGDDIETFYQERFGNFVHLYNY